MFVFPMVAKNRDRLAPCLCIRHGRDNSAHRECLLGRFGSVAVGNYSPDPSSTGSFWWLVAERQNAAHGPQGAGTWNPALQPLGASKTTYTKGAEIGTKYTSRIGTVVVFLAWAGLDDRTTYEWFGMVRQVDGFRDETRYP